MLSLILSREGRELISQPIAGETITVGRSFDNTLQLIDPTISRTHCRIEQRDGTPCIVDLSRNGILLNGKEISTAPLVDGDVLKLGPWTATIAERTDDADLTVVSLTKPTRVLSFDVDQKILTEEKFFLSIVTPDQKAFKKTVGKAEIVFGTYAGADIAIADPYVSRQHCKLILKEGTPVLFDLGSTNGTFVDNVRIDRITLPADGSFTIGKTEVRYRLGTSEERISPYAKASFGSMLGKSTSMREVFSLIQRAAPSDVTVCIHGESGTGKELAAREIHCNSSRRNGPFIPLNCGAIPATIIESMLFGHERGAFTGAVERQAGVFEQAHGGTLFLDEIGEMELNLQSRLLRVLEDAAIRRLGSKEDTPIDVRLVVATNRDLKQLVMEHRFREDLFYRLYVLPLFLPPLRERKEDIPLLANFFVEKHAPAGTSKKLADKAIDKLTRHPWHGNVRELKNTLMRAMIIARGMTIEARDIQFVGAMLNNAQDAQLDDREREAIVDALRKANGNQSRAARLLGIARTTIAYKIGRYGINPKNL